ncbi:MAG: hypothetical protein E7E21_10670 [Peptostreptococcaceae bacterium]|nr:hypothetical protein [Peptostreptococcaceae bacterium]
MQVTSLEQLKNIKLSEIVELPSFEDGTPLIVEIRKPNMMQLITSGKIPNTLLNVAMDMFNGKTGDKMQKASQSSKDLSELVKMMNVIAETSLVNPCYEDFKTTGVDLSDDQLMAILMYSQGGVKSLENFRKQQASTKDNQPSE